MRIILAAFALFVLPWRADAREADFKSAAGYPCDIIVAGTRQTKAEALQWTLGYLSGRLEGAPNTPHRKFYGPDIILRDIIAYCRSNPSDRLSDAAEDLLR